MRSIRWSLVTYFLLLALAALGAASWVVYRAAAQSLTAEHDTNRKLLIAQHEDQLREAKAKLDVELLGQARTLAALTQSQFQWRRLELVRLMPLGMISAGASPHGDLLMPVWASTGVRSPLNFQLIRRVVTDIAVPEELLPRDLDIAAAEYFQINSEWGAGWNSRNMEGRVLPFEPDRLSSSQIVDWAFDDVALPTGPIGRRVQFKAPVTRIRFVREMPTGPPPPPEDRPGPQRGPRGGANLITETQAPWIVVHCASETDRRDAQVARLTSYLATQLTELETQADAALLRLRTRLFAIGLATFAATAIGGFLIIGFGLAPLRRLSEAVSKVSARDFRLQLDDKRLPTELDPIADRLRGTLGQLRAAFDREKQAVADISHELRTPVTALLATLDVVLRKTRSAEEYRQALVDARNVGGHMRHLVERLLALARLDAGVARVQAGAVEVAELVQQCLTLIRPLAAEQILQLQSEVPRDLIWSTDADKLRDVLVNLLHNAVQYNRPGGSITVTGQVRDDRLEVAVTDTGIGMTPESAAKVFERFYRADAAREEAALHAGLGLSIVRGYAELLGGTIDVVSQLGIGTTFTIRLPALGALSAVSATCDWPRDDASQAKSAVRELVKV